jgi:dTDP-4-dehydrorhamnose 3,5-epimerase
MKISQTKIPGVLLIEPVLFRDLRGHFMESWHRGRYGDAGLPDDFVQDNLSYSYRRVLRGLHFQQPNPQGKLVSVPHGAVFDVVVDIRVGSPTFASWTGFVLSGKNYRQLFIPPGLAHGFVVTSEVALFSYKCTEYYRPSAEITLLWNDPQLAIAWPVNTPKVSAKDQAGYRLSDIPQERLPRFASGHVEPYRWNCSLTRAADIPTASVS